MLKKTLRFLICTLLVLLLIFVFCLAKYFYKQNENYKLMKYLKKTYKTDWFNYEKNSYFQRIYSLLEPHLLMHKVYVGKEKLEFIRFDYRLKNDYTIAKQALENSDVLIGYGIGKIIHFENSYSQKYNKKSYAFDCGTRKETIIKQISSPLCEFQEECIKTDDFIEKIYISNNKIHSFEDKLKELNLKNKKIYVKMSITGAEYKAMPEILKYANQITGISLEINLEHAAQIIDAIDLIKEIEKDFILVYRSTFNITPLRSHTLAFINKNLISKDYIPLNQSNNVKYEYVGYDKDKQDLMLRSSISPMVVVGKKLEKFIDYKN